MKTLTQHDELLVKPYIDSKIQTLTNQVKDMNNVLGSKNSLPIKYSKITTYGITWKKSNDGYVILNGTSTASPAQQSLFDETPTSITSNTGTIISLKELGIDGTKKYIFSRDTKIANVRPRIDLWSDSAKLAEIELSNNDGLYKEIDFSQYPTCTGIKATIQVTLNTTLTDAIQKIMLCLKSVYELDSTYVPYAKTNQQLTQDTTGLLDNLEVNGAVNMCKNNAVTQTTSDGTTTFTWTVNDDKTVTVSAPSYPVTLASTQGIILWNISADECEYLVGKTVKLTGCPSGGGDTEFDILAYRVGSTDGSTGTSKDYGNGVTFTWLNNGSSTKALISINIRSDYEMTGPLTFKPMITVPSYNGDYVPYAKSNKELTEDVTPEYFDLSVRGNRCTILAQNNCKVGKQVFIWCAITYTQTIANAPVLTVPSGYCPQSVVGTNYGIPINIIDSSSPSDHTVARYAKVYSSGELDIYNVEQNKTYVVSGCYIID